MSFRRSALATVFATAHLLVSQSAASAQDVQPSVLPISKPDVPAAAVVNTVLAEPPTPLPTKKPPYFGPFGRDYTYLLTETDRADFARALAAAKARRWSQATELVEDIENPTVSHIIAWLYLRETGARTPFKARAEFIREHEDWPQIATIKNRAEEVAGDKSLSTDEVIDWFEDYPPQTGPGMAALARAYKDRGLDIKAREVAAEAWRDGTFTRAQERSFLRTFSEQFSEADHQERLERLLWDGHTNSARRMLSRVSRDYRRLAEARIALFTRAYGVDGTIAKVPESLKNDPGLIYDRMKWRRKRGRYDDAAELLDSPGLDETRPDLWWTERRILTREAISEGNISEAYTIASSHKASDALSVSEAEWLAGWIQLQFLDDPDAALPHFYKVYDAVAFPVSLSRGAYWAGRALEAGGDAELASTWYQKAAVHITTFHGQLALAKLEGTNLPQLPSDPLPTSSERNSFHEGSLAQAVRLLAEAGNTDHLRRFVLAAAKASDYATERHMAAEMVAKFGRQDLGVWVARRASQDHITLIEHGYPVPVFDYPGQPEQALILAITRQESNFDVRARSRAGARGLMQLMPATAKAVSRQMRVSYSRDALTQDAAYNISLGSRYLADLIKQFDGSYIMAIAGYNAGPHRVRRWVREFGDPRTEEVDPIDWIEQIPFTETRNYVQRVMENLQTYRAILAESQQVAQTLPDDLSRPDGSSAIN